MPLLIFHFCITNDRKTVKISVNTLAHSWKAEFKLPSSAYEHSSLKSNFLPRVWPLLKEEALFLQTFFFQVASACLGLQFPVCTIRQLTSLQPGRKWLSHFNSLLYLTSGSFKWAYQIRGGHLTGSFFWLKSAL